MKAVCWYGVEDVRVEEVPDPRILNPRDAIVKVTLTAICGSDLHLYDGYIPMMQKGDVLGHEFMGEVVEVGPEVTNLAPGDRVVVPFSIACGSCHPCHRDLHALCDNSNPNAYMLEKAYGYSGAGLFGYSHLYGGYAGGQAEYVRVPYADVGPLKVPEGLRDEQVLFLTDVLPTAWQAVDQADPKPGDVVAIWGCGPVGLMAIKCAFLRGIERVIAIDTVPERVAMARREGATVLDFEDATVVEALRELTGGRGPDICIDAVGLEAHGVGVADLYDRARHMVRLQTDRPLALRQVIQAAGKGARVSIPGVYGGVVDKFPIGAAFAKGLRFAMGQTHVQRHQEELLGMIVEGRIDPSFLITHRFGLEAAPEAYRMFRDKTDDCIKVVLRP